MTDATGKIVWSARYAAFGRAHVSPNSTYSNNIRFQGQYEDRKTGLHYNYHRYYNPERGRYLSKDPIGLMGGVNLRGYANPVNTVDPFGLNPLTIDEMEKVIDTNNKSGLSNNTILCLTWKESGFNPASKSKSSTATGLTQMTKGAVTQVNKSLGTTYNHSNMVNSADAISAGSQYMKIRIQWAKNDIAKGLDGYGTGKGYSENILQCSTCLDKVAACTEKSYGSKQACLDKIQNS